MFPTYDLASAEGREGFEARLTRLKDTVSMDGAAAATVAEVVVDVKAHGDAAIVKYMQKWTDPQFSADRIRVSEEELAAADSQLTGDLRQAILTAIEQVKAYQAHILPRESEEVEIGGAKLGLRFTPVDSAGLYVPGGTAILFSTLVMTAVPALIAGVPAEKLAVVCPPPTRQGDEEVGDISPIVLATAYQLGIKNVYRLGGAQAVAALAYGSESVEPVDFIAGPGNVFVQLAKAQVRGVVGTEGGFYGPSEIVTIADNTANPARVASDLIAQAEHNPGKCFLVAWEQGVIDAVIASLESQLAERDRREAIDAALIAESCAILVADEAEAVEVTNRLATEHLNLAVANPDSWLDKIRHAGEIFIGDETPVAAGDYYAGPSHCLPTGTTGRFASGLSVYTFLKRTGTVGYPQGLSAQAIKDIATMAKAEGLDGHAASVTLRGD